jgi:hypothetical protein
MIGVATVGLWQSYPVGRSAYGDVGLVKRDNAGSARRGTKPKKRVQQRRGFNAHRRRLGEEHANRSGNF